MSKLDQLDLRTKASLGRGASFWRTEGIPGAPAVLLTDGPHGVRAQTGAEDHLGIAPSAPATCFPPAAGLAQSWSPELVRRVAGALAVEARASGVGVLLGPGINIKRDPRGGRNFEYFSEDPQLTAILGTEWVRGLQAGGVGASVKHFAANNAETDRMRSDSVVDERTLREIYLWAFERTVRRAAPWTVMASYNKVNGVLAAENAWLLTDVLRGDWHFDGAVVSDWGAVRDRVSSVRAGLDLQMPGGDRLGDDELVAAVTAGELEEAAVDAAAQNVMALLGRVAAGRAKHGADAADLDAHHALAREAAARSIVLLKNNDATLPLNPATTLAVIGPFALSPRFQGGGSSHVNAYRVDVPLEEITALSTGQVVYESGIGNGEGDAVAARGAAIRAAKDAQAAVIFLGLADAEETEGSDRTHIRLPHEQLELLRDIAAVQPTTVVVLSHGGVVDLGDVDRHAAAVLDGALLGQGGGNAIARVLFGEVNPSGRLNETVPVRLQDVPSYLSFPGQRSTVVYGEGIHVGYRWYDARDLPVLYPFGHGLSYTHFAYEELSAEVLNNGDVNLRVKVRNGGSRRGHEVVQTYLSAPGTTISRPVRELKAFASVELDTNESVLVDMIIPREDLAFWDTRTGSWVVEGGSYGVSVGASSRDLRLRTSVEITGHVVHPYLGPDATMAEVAARPGVADLLAMLQPASPEDTAATGETLGMDVSSIMGSIPLDRMRALSGGQFPPELLQEILRVANTHPDSVTITG